MTFKNNFKQLHEDSGFSVIEIAKRTNISQDILYKMRNNPYYNASFDTITKLCEFFKCEPGDLIISENEDNSPVLQTSGMQTSDVLVTQTSSAKPSEASPLLHENIDNYYSGLNFFEGISSLSPKQRDNLLTRIVEVVVDALDGSKKVEKA